MNGVPVNLNVLSFRTGLLTGSIRLCGSSSPSLFAKFDPVPPVRPVSGAHPALIRIFLPWPILLACVRHGHITCIRYEARLVGLGAQIVTRNARVSNEQVSRICAYFDPLQVFLLKPLHTILSISVPLMCPCWDALLSSHIFVVIVRQKMTSRANDKASVVRSIR